MSDLLYTSCLAKQQAVKALFSACLSAEDKYQKIIELGRQLAPLQAVYKTPENLVRGCQSNLYLHASWMDGKVAFTAAADALISAGLAALLVKVYGGESPEVILKCPPAYLDELGIGASLTPNRANGLYSIHLRMKQEALKFLLEQDKSGRC